MRGSSILATVLVACMASTAMADPGNNDSDAGSGVDAGDTRAAALLVNFATTYAGRARGPDVDWYSATQSAGGPTCVKMTGTTASDAYFALGGEQVDGSTQAPILIGRGTEAAGGIAGVAPMTSTLRIARTPTGDGPGHYTFRMDRFGVPAQGDGGTGGDVGNADAALPVQPGCIGGHLSAIGSLDMRDVYSVTVPTGEIVTYSLASTAGGHTLSLLNAAGETVGPVLEPGGLATVGVPTSGTYFLSAQRTTAIGDVGYLVGIVVGPEPSACRPYCLG